MVDLWGPRAFGAADAATSRPPHTPLNAPGDADSFYQDCSSPSADDGTEWRAAAINMMLEQMRGVVRRSGIPDDNLDSALLLRAIRSQRSNYIAVGGTPSALTAALNPVLAAHQVGLMLRIVPGAVINASATLNAGPGDLPILRLDGSPIERGDIPANVPTTVVCTGSAWVLAGLAYSDVRRRLKGDLTIYVRPDGNDANDGLADTSGRALRQPHRALELLRQVYDAAGRAVTIRCAGGTYAAPYVDGLTTSNVSLIGNYANPETVIIDGTTVDFPITMIGASQLKVSGVTFSGTKSVSVSSASMMTVENCRFANGTGGQPKISATYSAIVSMAVGNTFFNSAASALYAGPNSSIVSPGFVSFQGTPVFADATVVANVGYVDVSGGFGGSAVGRRYRGSQSGAIYTAGGGANFIPGDAAGVLDASSSYI